LLNQSAAMAPHHFNPAFILPLMVTVKPMTWTFNNKSDLCSLSNVHGPVFITRFCSITETESRKVVWI